MPQNIFSLCYFLKSYSDYFQHFSRKLFQTMKTIRVSKVLMKSLRLIKCLPVLYMWLNVSLCWGLSVCLQPLLWGLQTGTWSLYFVPCDGYFFTALANKRCWNCSLCQLTAVADCSELPLGQSGSKRALQHFSVSSAINTNPSPENPPSSLDTSKPCSQPAAL